MQEHRHKYAEEGKWQRKKIVHCNLQPSNVLLDENFEAQISGLRYCLRSNLKNFLFEETEACYTSPGWYTCVNIFKVNQ